MSFYARYILPRLIATSCAAKPVTKQREKVVPLARGIVLEIGAGGGLNFSHYDQAEVKSVFALDRSAELLSMAEKKAVECDLDIRPIHQPANTIPLDNNAVDTVLVTYTLCSIEDLTGALGEMRRVLRPTGQLVFCEHGQAPDPGIHTLQRRLTPVWRRLAGGCRLDRDFPGSIERAGFHLEKVDQMYLPGTPRIFGYNSWGVAAPL